VLPLIQILGVVVIAILAVWLVRRARARSQSKYEQLAPHPPTVSEIVAAAEPVAESNGSDSQVVAESNGATPKLVAISNGAGPEVSELEAELREIYDKVGHPEAFEEAKGKVTDLAADLVERDGTDMDEALRTAYDRSLAEHREYLTAKGLA
jgi:hypothetical protein